MVLNEAMKMKKVTLEIRQVHLPVDPDIVEVGKEGSDRMRDGLNMQQELENDEISHSEQPNLDSEEMMAKDTTIEELEEGVERLKEHEKAAEIARREAETRIHHLQVEKHDAENYLKESRERKKRAEEMKIKANRDRKKAEAEREMMEEESRKAEETIRKVEEELRMAEDEQKQAEEQKVQTQHEREMMSTEVKRLREELEQAMFEEKNTLQSENDDLKLQIADVPIWVGTEALQTLDGTVHTLTPTTLTQIIKLEKNSKRTAFTFPIDEGEWELKIRASDNTFKNVMLGYIKYPLPENATQRSCGSHDIGIGGHFNLWIGRMWKGGEFKPEGTNKKCNRVGQTAAIRVNMTTREARLFVDDEEQPGIFTDIPSPLCLGISTQNENQSVELLWLKRFRGNDELERVALEERITQKSEFGKLKLQQVDLPIWVGTESLQTLDRTAHTLTPTTLTQIIKLEKDWRTAFTIPIDEGEWELKIRASENDFVPVMLGFLRHPLPEDAPQKYCGSYHSGIGGDFILWDGRMWQGGKEFKPVGTNKKCDRIGQTATIRVNMSTREARLFVDDEEQSGIFTDIPSPLCLGISTHNENHSVEVLWLKRLRGNNELEQSALEERRTRKLETENWKLQLAGLPIWVGTESLQTLDRTVHSLTPTTLTQINKHELGCWRTTFTLPINEGEWELKISGQDTSWQVMLGFVRYPLPENATQRSCGLYSGGIGGDFVVWSGSMWRRGEFKPKGINKKCDRVGQTAAIRVNMTTREARLFVDDEEQPGIFTDIPSPLCLGISTEFHDVNLSVEVLWLKRLRGNDELERSALEERRTQKLESEKWKLQLAGLPIWVGTESLQTLDRTAHALTPTTLTQIMTLEPGGNWRTSFTFPIDEGEWELKLRKSERARSSVMLGFLRHPLPDNATQNQCGSYRSGIGGDFILWDGRIWREGKEFKPAGTNKKCDQAGQTAAIRVNMSTREARLFVDDEEQPGIFTDIPSPLCLGISTHNENHSVEVSWLKRLRGNDELEQSALEERRTQKLESEQLKLQLAGLPIWVGTESLQTLDSTAHRLTPTTLTQLIETSNDDPWRTAFTFPINEGEWELKLRSCEDDFLNVLLGFLRHPLPENATQNGCGCYGFGIGGHFILWKGGMWKEGKEFKPEGTNKKCNRIGQIAAIRVNMSTREARLFVDDEEQPGIFTDIPSPLCLGISTGGQTQHLEVLWLKRLRS
ncbi:hypothetical protein BLNAU_10171 [Blattamonas nauphoetae]|uniref:Uncharacterized protein n=1 Tax=Blattamonas nauphoetae TaxID=2049346 RepID=A0ABQ9XTN1_9EUKA|nr:hypothetical protein BLNAU_10171 [Blattamonas nauphoetae]